MPHPRIAEIARQFHETIERSVRTDEQRQEVSEMKETIADVLKKEGEVRGLQLALLHQLRKRFGKIPPDAVSAMEATQDVKRLHTWLERVLSAATLEEMRIG